MNVIILPAYNEAKSIEPFFHSILVATQGKHDKYSILVCDDGSTDETHEILMQLKDSYPIKFEIIRHKINRGLGETVRDLIEHAIMSLSDEDIIIRMDCDNTHNPKYIESMISRLNEGYDLVIASRFVEGGNQLGLNRKRKFLSFAATNFMKIIFGIKNINEFTCGFRAYRVSILKEAIRVYGNNFIQLKNLGFVCTLEKLIKIKLLGATISEIPFTLEYNKKLSASKMVFNVTVFGYFVMAVLYFWPRSGWKSTYSKNRN